VRHLPSDHIAVQGAKFVAVGLLSASAYSATIVALVEFAARSTAVATMAGFALGTLISYTLNTLFTFQRKLQGRSFARFWIVTGIGLLISVSIVEGSVALGLHYGVGVFASLIVGPAFNFTAHRMWTYRGTEPTKPTP
jgi:putative flippase GtrA